MKELGQCSSSATAPSRGSLSARIDRNIKGWMVLLQTKIEHKCQTVPMTVRENLHHSSFGQHWWKPHQPRSAFLRWGRTGNVLWLSAAAVYWSEAHKEGQQVKHRCCSSNHHPSKKEGSRHCIWIELNSTQWKLYRKFQAFPVKLGLTCK